MKIINVDSKKEYRQFIKTPVSIFHGHPLYVPPLWMDELKGYDKKNNPILSNSDFQLFMVLDKRNNPVARAIAYMDKSYNEFYRTNIGFFGSFDCVRDKKCADLIIEKCELWLKDRNADAIRGPINPVAENWGFVYEGYDKRAVYMAPWNPEYYHEFFLSRDYSKVKDLYVYEADMDKGYVLPPRYESFAKDFFIKYPDMTLRSLDMKDIEKDAYSIWEISNMALSENWGYVPLDLAVMKDMLKKLKFIVDPDAVLIAEYNGSAVGFCLGFPDINGIIKDIGGKLFPFGWAVLLKRLKKITDYRLFGLAVHPSWQSRGLDALMYIQLYKNLAYKKIRMEANYILEDNYRIKNSLEKLGMKKIITYRIYEKPLNKLI